MGKCHYYICHCHGYVSLLQIVTMSLSRVSVTVTHVTMSQSWVSVTVTYVTMSLSSVNVTVKYVTMSLSRDLSVTVTYVIESVDKLFMKHFLGKNSIYSEELWRDPWNIQTNPLITLPTMPCYTPTIPRCTHHYVSCTFLHPTCPPWCCPAETSSTRVARSCQHQHCHLVALMMWQHVRSTARCLCSARTRT